MVLAHSVAVPRLRQCLPFQDLSDVATKDMVVLKPVHLSIRRFEATFELSRAKETIEDVKVGQQGENLLLAVVCRFGESLSQFQKYLDVSYGVELDYELAFFEFYWGLGHFKLSVRVRVWKQVCW